MSDDQNRDEIEALKARLAKLEGGTTPAPPEPAVSRSDKPLISLKFWQILVIALSLWLFSLIFLGKETATTSSEDRPDPPSCDDARAKAAAELLLRAPWMRGTDMNREDGMVLLVSWTGWNRLGLERQKQVIATMDCAIAGGNGHLREIHVRTSRRGADLDNYSAIELLDLRRRGYAPRAAAAE